MQISSPEYKDFSCKSKSAPTILLPAHAAPLGMVYLTSKDSLGPLKNGLLIAYHGYRKTGHRIVWQPFNSDEELVGAPADIV
jgi:glucose/arabinose dehydrogenase